MSIPISRGDRDEDFREKLARLRALLPAAVATNARMINYTDVANDAQIPRLFDIGAVRTLGRLPPVVPESADFGEFLELVWSDKILGKG
jgi:hypothetical protein